MREDTTPPFYFSPLPPAYSQPVEPPPTNDTQSAGDDNHAIDSLIRQRPRLLQIKLAVLATQIWERLQIRNANLRKIDVEMLVVSTALLPFEDWRQHDPFLDAATKRFWTEQQNKLTAEQRSQEVECWRDVAQSMNDFLTVWEAVEQAKVRGEFLRDQQSEDTQ